MKATAGPLMEKYAEKFGYTVDDVVGWVNAYINPVGEWVSHAQWLEATDRDRAISIKAYMVRETA